MLSGCGSSSGPCPGRRQRLRRRRGLACVPVRRLQNEKIVALYGSTGV